MNRAEDDVEGKNSVQNRPEESMAHSLEGPQEQLELSGTDDELSRSRIEEGEDCRPVSQSGLQDDEIRRVRAEERSVGMVSESR